MAASSAPRCKHYDARVFGSCSSSLSSPANALHGFTSSKKNPRQLRARLSYLVTILYTLEMKMRQIALNFLPFDGNNVLARKGIAMIAKQTWFVSLHNSSRNAQIVDTNTLEGDHGIPYLMIR